MAHNLFGERFEAREKPGWHSLGHVFTDSPTATEAIQRARMDYTVTLRPILVDLGGMAMPIADKVAIVREPTADDDNYRIFGYASPNYGLMQNIDIARIIDPLAEVWSVETAGALGLGERMFITLDAGEHDVKGDPCRDFFLISDMKDGKTAMDIAFTKQRVVCENTLVAGLKQATIRGFIQHHAIASDELAWRVQLLKQLEDLRQRVNASFEAMASTALTAPAAAMIFEKAYPLPKTPARVKLAGEVPDEAKEALSDLMNAAQVSKSSYEWAKARAESYRDASAERYAHFNDTVKPKKLAATAWAAYNAVVEVEDYRLAKGEENNPDLARDALVSALFGPRAAIKQKAYEAAMAVVR